MKETNQKLTRIQRGSPSWCESSEDQKIRAKNVISTAYSLASPFIEFIQILNLVIKIKALFADKQTGVTEII